MVNVRDEGDLAFYVVWLCSPLATALSPYRHPPRIVPVNDVRYPTSFGLLGDTAQTDRRPLLGPAQTKPRCSSGLEGRPEHFRSGRYDRTARRLASRPNLQFHASIDLPDSSPLPRFSLRNLTTID